MAIVTIGGGVGMSIGGGAYLYNPVDVATPPSTVDVDNVETVQVVMPAPTLSEGRPVDWTPTSVTRVDWGRLQVVIDGQDVTFFRGAPINVESWQKAEPFGDANAFLQVPQVTMFEDFGSGDLTWLKQWADVEIFRIPPSGSKELVFEGMIASFNASQDADTNNLTVECIGALYQLDLYVRAPKFIEDYLLNEIAIRGQFNLGTRPHLRCNVLHNAAPAASATMSGFITRNTGSWDKALSGYVQGLLSMMRTQSNEQWTMEKIPYRTPSLRVKDTTTTHWTITAGTPGTTMDLMADYAEATNVFYGEGSDEAGTVWRNASVDSGLTNYSPLAQDAAYLDQNTNPDSVRIEDYVTFGGGVSLADAQDAAEQQIDTFSDPGWSGTITLTVDPEEGSRFSIEDGENILVKHFRGTGAAGQLFHIASVEVGFADGTVTLTVDTKGRDYATLLQTLARKGEGNFGPTGKLEISRLSAMTDDLTVPWDYNSGSGYIPTGFRSDSTATIAVPTGTWVIEEFKAATSGTIVKTEIRAYSDANAGTAASQPFHVSFYDQFLGTTDLPADPFVTDAWKPSLDGLSGPPPFILVGWGQEGQRAGYYPGLESDGDAATGVMIDEGSWSFNLRRGEGVLYVAFYQATGSTLYFQGRLTIGVGQ